MLTSLVVTYINVPELNYPLWKHTGMCSLIVSSDYTICKLSRLVSAALFILKPAIWKPSPTYDIMDLSKLKVMNYFRDKWHVESVTWTLRVTAIELVLLYRKQCFYVIMLTTPGWLHVRRGKVSIGIEIKQVIIPDNSLEMSTAVKSAALDPMNYCALHAKFDDGMVWL